MFFTFFYALLNTISLRYRKFNLLFDVIYQRSGEPSKSSQEKLHYTERMNYLSFMNS